MNMEFLIGALVAVIIVIVIRVGTKRTPAQTHYDEMQQQLREKGYRLGYLVTLIGMAALMLLLEGGLLKQVEPSLCIFFVLMAGIITFVVYCIQKEAFFSIGQRSTYYIVICAVVVVLNGISAMTHILTNQIWDNGVITFDNGCYLISSLSFLIVLIAIVLKKASAGKGEEE